jgi:hypothetical protein
MSLISWLHTGNNSNYFILDVLHLPQKVLDEALQFISGTCYYRETQDSNKFLKFPGISPMVVQPPAEAIELESLFINAYPEGGADDPRNQDLYRFQSNPDAKDVLCANHAISNIIGKICSILIKLTGIPHSLIKISVLFSRPGGQEQGLHVNDVRMEEVVSRDGELLSVIIALMHDTNVNIRTVNNGRKSFYIPRGAMIVMGGNCLHSGSSYSKCKARLHLEFLPIPVSHRSSTEQVFHNTVGTRFTCPLVTCPIKTKDSHFLLKRIFTITGKTSI